MGEAVRLTDAERTKVAEAIVSAANGLPVTLGTTANSTKAVIDRSYRSGKTRLSSDYGICAVHAKSK